MIATSINSLLNFIIKQIKLLIIDTIIGLFIIFSLLFIILLIYFIYNNGLTFLLARFLIKLFLLKHYYYLNYIDFISYSKKLSLISSSQSFSLPVNSNVTNLSYNTFSIPDFVSKLLTKNNYYPSFLKHDNSQFPKLDIKISIYLIKI